MQLSQEAIQEFIDIYKKEFGEDLVYETAEQYGKELLNLYSLITPRQDG